MPITLSNLKEKIAKGTIPGMVLVGGDNEYLADHVFHTLREDLISSMVGVEPESFREGTSVSLVIDNYRTFSLFAKPRLLILPDVTAFISKKELSSTYDKEIKDWNSAKTDRKRDSSMAKLLHVLGLAGLEVDDNDSTIAGVLGVESSSTFVDMLEIARNTGRTATKGESDAAILAEAANQGGAPGTTLLMKTGKLPEGSATIEAIDRAGAVVVCDLTRQQVPTVIKRIIGQVEEDAGVIFEPAAIAKLEQRLGIKRMLEDKYAKEIPDLRTFASEAERLATFAGDGGRVRASMIEDQVAEVAGGARFEFGSLVTEGKPVEAVAKLRDLVAQARRENPSIPLEMVYGKYLFPLADEIRQLLAVQSFARLRGVDPRRGMSYNQFKSVLADELGAYLVSNSLVRSKPHPFPLHKRFQAAGRYREEELVTALREVARLEVARKSGGTSAEIGLEIAVLGMTPAGRRN